MPVRAISGEPNACAASSISGTPSSRELRERRRAPEQVHGHDRLRPRRDPRGDVLGIEVQRRRVDVGEDRRRAAARDRLGRRVERERRADDLVAGADPERVERRARARRCRWRRRPSPARRGSRPPRARSALTFGPRMNVARPRARRRIASQLGHERRVLRLDVNERDLRHGESSLEDASSPQRLRYDRERRRSRRRSRTRRSGSRGGSAPSSRRAPSPTPAKREAPDRRAERASARCSGRAASRKTPAGIEMNERTTGVRRPTKTASRPSGRTSARRARAGRGPKWNQRPRRSSSGRRRRTPIAQPAIAPTSSRACRPAPWRRSAQAARRSCSRRGRPRAGERARGDGAGVDHDELARGGEDRVDGHQQEHGVERRGRRSPT